MDRNRDEERRSCGWFIAKAYTSKEITDVNVLVISGTTGSSAQIGRSEGFDQYVESEGWNKLDEQTGDFTQDGGQKVSGVILQIISGQVQCSCLPE